MKTTRDGTRDQRGAAQEGTPSSPTVNLIGEPSPVSINAGAEVKLTPLAFLNTAIGFKAGTGWSFFGLFNGSYILGYQMPIALDLVANMYF